MALMAKHGEITPMPKCAIFADTQDEPASVYKWLDWLEKELPFPVYRETAGHLSKRALTLKTAKNGNIYAPVAIPAYTINPDGSFGINRRDCTQDFKINVLRRKMLKLAGKFADVIQWIGISMDECHRMKPSRHVRISNKWPLVEARIRRSGCLQWMRKHGYPKPPRSACIYCPYHSDAEWRRLRAEEPEAFSRAVKFDKDYREMAAKCSTFRAIPYLHNSRVPLDQVDFSTDEDHGQQVMFGNECEGMCGV